jgi:thiamine-phosphate pyrophosphorylase
MPLFQPGSAQPQAAIRRKLLAAARLASAVRARNGCVLPRAWFMTDPRRTPHPERIAGRLPPGFGVIYRHFGAKDRFDAGARLARVCRRRRLVLLVSADPVLAQAIGADGVHWPEAQLAGVRKRRRRMIETASAHSREAIARAARLGVDAVILSAVFTSGSPSAAKPIGALRFRRLAAQAPLPVYALGGVGADNASRALAYGRAAGWAAIDAVLEGWKD